MRRVRYSLTAAVAAFMVLAVAPLGATNEARLRDWLEGRRVTVRIDMPGTHEGVNLHPDSRRTLDADDYRRHLRRYGVSIPAGETAVITLVKVKKDLIEVQLDGGGYGTFFDDTDTSAHIPFIGKTDRERSLEREIRDEPNRDRRRRLERELDGLRSWRERENHRIAAERARLSMMKEDRLAIRRAQGGSRFNLRFRDRVPYGLEPEDIMAMLSEYVDFGPSRARWR
jgi:hypothetical protein